MPRALPHARAAAVGVALRRADRKPGDLRDLGEADVEGVLERDHRRLRRRQLGQAAAELAAGFGGGERRDRDRRRGPAARRRERLGAAHGARLCEVLARVDDQAVQPRGELRLAPELADPHDELRERLLGRVARVLGVAQEVEREPLDPRRVPPAERLERLPVARFRPRHEDRIREPLVVERVIETSRVGRPSGERGCTAGKLYSAWLLCQRWSCPRLRGSFGRAVPARVRGAVDAVDAAAGCAPRYGRVRRAPDGGPRAARARVGRRGGERTRDVHRPPAAAARGANGRSSRSSPPSGRRGDRARSGRSSTPTTSSSPAGRSPGSSPRRATTSCSGSESTSARRPGRAQASSSATGSSCSWRSSSGWSGLQRWAAGAYTEDAVKTSLFLALLAATLLVPAAGSAPAAGLRASSRSTSCRT